MTLAGYRLGLLYWLPLLLAASSQSPQIDSIRSYRASHIDSIIDVDGKLDEASWSLTPSSEIFRDVATCEPGLFETTYQAVYDSTHLYIGITAYDPDVSASIKLDNKPLYKYDSTLELFLDPGADGKDYYELQINAYNAIWQLSFDKPLKQGGKAVNPDNLIGLKTATYVSGSLNDHSDIDKYWSVEIAIPWLSLGDRDALLSQMWKINLGRVYHGTDGELEFWAWSCAYELDMHLPLKWGDLRF